jgi:HD-GYP domain-containing protein (c-di-GMP phosphodiesterase class II)
MFMIDDSKDFPNDARGAYALPDQLDWVTSAVDAKDRYTRAHSRRVALLARKLAVACGMTAAGADRVYLAGLFHDIGKIGVPESILHKPGRLSDDEFELMKLHAELGAMMLDDVPDFGDLAAAVLHHHERFDGRGYPRQLSGQDIPLAARILCLADSLDAMTSHRPYKKPVSLGDALQEISRCAGDHFDPEISAHLDRIPRGELERLLAA